MYLSWGTSDSNDMSAFGCEDILVLEEVRACAAVEVVEVIVTLERVWIGMMNFEVCTTIEPSSGERVVHLRFFTVLC